MPFGRGKKKKKEKEKKRKEDIMLLEELAKREEKEEEEEEITPAYVEKQTLKMEIKEVAKLVGGKPTAKGEIRIRNESMSHIASVEVELENIKNTTLSKPRIFIPLLSKAGDMKSEVSYQYNINNIAGNLINIREKLMLEGALEDEPVLIKGKEMLGEILIEIENASDVEVSSVYLKRILPKEFVVLETDLGTKGLAENVVEGSTDNIFPNRSISISIKIKAQTTSKNPVDLGTLEYSTQIAKPLSGISVKKFEGRGIIRTSVRSAKKADMQDLWEATVEIENPNDYSVTIYGRITPMGGVISREHLMSDLILEEGAVRIEELSISPQGRRSIGPIPVRSTTVPKFDIEITPVVTGVVSYHSEIKSSLKLGSVPVLWAELTKGVEVKHDKIMAELLERNAIPSSGRTPVLVTLSITNKGSAPIGYIQIVETIPAGFERPSKITVKRGAQQITPSISIDPDTQDTRVEKTVIIEIGPAALGNQPLKTGESIKVSYEIVANNPSGDVLILYSYAKVSTSPENIAYEIELPDEKVPVLKVKEIREAVEVSKDLDIEGDDEFKITIRIHNSSNIPVLNYVYKEFVPTNFKILEVAPTAKQAQKAKGTSLEWKIDKIGPDQDVYLTYRVKGIGEYRIDELLKV